MAHDDQRAARPRLPQLPACLPLEEPYAQDVHGRVTRPAENQQTVEAALTWAGNADETELRDAARAALRDLVAQAELAAGMGHRLRRMAYSYHQSQLHPRSFDVCTWPQCRHSRFLLARLDGAR